MFQDLDVFRMSAGMAAHAAERQALVAGNIANADTPGYRARDIASFADVFRGDAATAPMRVTRPGHLSGADGATGSFTPFDAAGPSSPNGNTVSLETEMMRSVEARQEHDRAITVYKATLDLIRTALGRR